MCEEVYSGKVFSIVWLDSEDVDRDAEEEEKSLVLTTGPEGRMASLSESKSARILPIAGLNTGRICRL